MSDRKFNVGDLVVWTGKGIITKYDIPGPCIVRRVGVSNFGHPYVAVVDARGRGRAAQYEKYYDFWVPPPDEGKQSIDAGAEEYEEIIKVQDAKVQGQV